MSSILFGDTMVPNENQMKRKWKMKWKLGIYRGYIILWLFKLLFGDEEFLTLIR